MKLFFVWHRDVSGVARGRFFCHIFKAKLIFIVKTWQKKRPRATRPSVEK